MPEKCDRSGATLSDTPWNVVQRRTRTPIAAILSSAGEPSIPGGLSGRATQTPTRSSRVSPSTPSARERVDQPAFERGDEGAHVGAAALEVEHDIGHPLARPVIGELAAAPGAIDGKARVEEVGRLGAGPGRVERRVLDQPDALGGASLGDRLGARFHLRQRLRVFDQPGAPFDRRRAGRGGEGGAKREAGVAKANPDGGNGGAKARAAPRLSRAAGRALAPIWDRYAWRHYEDHRRRTCASSREARGPEDRAALKRRSTLGSGSQRANWRSAASQTLYRTASVITRTHRVQHQRQRLPLSPPSTSRRASSGSNGSVPTRLRSHRRDRGAA